MNRFSQGSRPREGERIRFSPGIILWFGIVSPHQPESKNRRGKVIKNSKYLTEVLFDGEMERDLVSPEFLIPDRLSRKKGKNLLMALMKGKENENN